MVAIQRVDEQFVWWYFKENTHLFTLLSLLLEW